MRRPAEERCGGRGQAPGTAEDVQLGDIIPPARGWGNCVACGATIHPARGATTCPTCAAWHRWYSAFRIASRYLRGVPR